jgi:hypothetical protein
MRSQTNAYLEDENREKLSPLISPHFPMGSLLSSREFDADIPTGQTVTSVGYWQWSGGESDQSPNDTSDEIKQGWKKSENALRPLVEWFHGVESLKLEPSSAKSTLCRYR